MTTGLPLVKYDCGCIGLTPNAQGMALLVQACDDREPEYGFFERDMSGKAWTALSGVDAATITMSLNLLIADGYRFRVVKDILASP